MKFTTCIVLVAACIVCCSCIRNDEVIFQQLIIADKHNLHAEDTVIVDKWSKKAYSRLSKPNVAGIQFYYELPTEYQDKHLYVVFDGKVRTNYAQSNAAMVLLAFDKNKNQLCWLVTPLRPSILKQNEWCHFRDSVHISNAINGFNYVALNAFPYINGSSNENLDIDSLKIIVKKIQKDL